MIQSIYLQEFIGEKQMFWTIYYCLTMQAKGRVLLRPEANKREYSIATATFTTPEPLSVPSLTCIEAQTRHWCTI
jgi:hypothetical protein